MRDARIKELQNALLERKMIDVSTETWSAEVLGAEGLVMVFFWADWCNPCHEMKPAVTQLANECEDEVKVVRLNIDENEEIAKDYRVSIVPTVMFFKEGRKRHEIITNVPIGRLKEAIDSL